MTSNSRWMESRLPRAQWNSKIKSFVYNTGALRLQMGRMETLVHYINPAHTLSLLGMLNDQRLIGQFCDVVLVVGGQRFQAHRTVLAASSEYFQSLFMKMDSEVHSTVQLDFCESHTFETVLNYIYTSSLFVDQTSLAAIQELGCSLGITFLTKIMSKKPQVSYSVSRKRVSFSEDDDNSCQQKSVIVCRSDRLGASVSCAKVLNPKGKMSSEQTQQTVELPSLPLKEPHKSLYCYQPNVNSTVPTDWKSVIGIIERGPDNHSSPSESLSKKPGAYMLSTRPPLTSSVSFSESEIQYNRILTDTMGLSKEQQPALSDHKQLHLDRPQETSQQEKSSPLIKRSLSMDSPIPIFSPALEPIVRTATEGSTDAEPSEPQKPKAVPLLVLPSKHCDADGETEVHKAEVHVKTEPSSPLADPSDIIRVTVGENWPINLRDFPVSFEDGPRGFFVHSGKDIKRKTRLESRRGLFKRSKGLNDHDFSHKDNRPSPAVCHSNVDGTAGQNEPRQSGTFKCLDCLKVFQSDTGLHRHVNMFHNPEKPYSCDICHKRFPTNFKVWTHRQTQHGVTQNVVPSFGAYTVTGERAQRKLVGAVQDREIKRSLMIKLKGNKPGSLPPQTYNKRCLRARSIIHTCPHCGKMFWCSSAQFRLHLNLHAGESLDRGAEAKDGLPMKQEEVVNLQEDVSKERYSCRLCDERLASLSELGDSDGECRHSTVCPYCGLRFSSQSVKKEHEAHCEYKKLTCLECMRTFKSSFSIWRHQVEVHNQNTMTTKGSPSLCFGDHNSEPRDESPKPTTAPVATLDSEASPLAPNDQSGLQCPDGVRVKEEPKEEAVDDEPKLQPENPGPVEPSLWSCEKCGKLFSVREQLERHQELLCYIKPFICHVCHKAFRTNFRLWSHFQSHTSSSEKPRAPVNKKRRPSSPSPSPPPAPHLPMPNPSPPAAKAERSLSVDAPRNTVLTGPAGGLRSRKSMSNKCPSPRESATLISQAPALSTLTFKKQLMCKFCHRTFKTAFSLWSHEQSHNNH